MDHKNTSNLISEFNAIYKENDDIYRSIAKSFGLADCAFWILYTLREDETVLTQSDICNLLYVPKQTVNSSLKKMETDGYIELLNTNNQRSKQIRLTKKGIELAEKTVDKVTNAECDAMTELSDEEQKIFFKLFHKYTDSLKALLSKLICE